METNAQPLDCPNVIETRFRTLRTWAALFSACQGLQGSVTVQAELIGEVGGLLMDELLELEGGLEQLRSAVQPEGRE